MRRSQAALFHDKIVLARMRGPLLLSIMSLSSAVALWAGWSSSSSSDATTGDASSGQDTSRPDVIENEAGPRRTLNLSDRS
jgi:hypothetical protein